MNAARLNTQIRLKRTAVALSCVATLGLGGCAQIMNFGDLMWSETKHATYKTSHKVMAMLRPKAKRAEPVFVYTQPQRAQSRSYPQAPALRGQTSPQYRAYEARSYETRPYNSAPLYASAPRAAATPSAQYQSRDVEPALAGAPETSGMPDMSYVKMSGSTSISDWQSCQAQAGSYIQPQGAGFVIHPNFDGCMRQRGYIPEREALVFMERQALP